MPPAAAAQPEVVAFADDSITDHVIVAAAAVIPVDIVPDAEVILAAAKTGAGVPAEEPMHCRVMFSGDGRRGTPWERVAPEEIERAVIRVCAELGRISQRPIVCHIERQKIPPGVSAAGSIFEGLEEKGMATFAYTGVFGHLTRRMGQPVRTFIDPDPTKIPWGEQRRQAHLTRTLFVDLVPGEEPKKLVPLVEGSPKPPLLQVADIYAYLAAHAYDPSGGRRNRWCREAYRTLAADDLVFEFSESQKWEATDEHQRRYRK